MKICVLQPDYSTSDVDYANYDPPRDLIPLLPGHEVHHVFLNKLTVYRQLKDLQHANFDVFVNLCEGYLEWEVPSIDVIYSLDLLKLPYTGPNTILYDPTKELMKYVAYCEGVATPAYAVLTKDSDAETACSKLRFPLFVKPAKAGDSLGIDDASLVNDRTALQEKLASSFGQFDEVLVEEYVKGREFTVLVIAEADGKSARTFQPVEYIFPKGFAFKTYALKTSELHPDANLPCTDPELDARLRSAALKIFRGFNGVGYARLDFRLSAEGVLYFLEINFTCSVFYTAGYEGSADHILSHDGIGQAGFLSLMIAEGVERHKRIQKKYILKGDSISGYGIYASRSIAPGELIFKGEGRSQRVITRRQVEENWPDNEKLTFRRYAYPLSNEVFLLWDDDPSEWAPQNHSCEPNTGYDGLDVKALRTIRAGEELTLDYSSFLDEHMEPFQCSCGSANCRKLIIGQPGNSVTVRENGRRS